jgi:hypothetical protein
MIKSMCTTNLPDFTTLALVSDSTYRSPSVTTTTCIEELNEIILTNKAG